LSDIPLSFLFGSLFFLVLLSAFFSGSETALMTLNRYRLKNLVKQGQHSAILAEQLLSKPDRLIGLILLGNNFANILASSLATIISIRLGGESAIAIGAGLLTLLVLIFAEVAPKTLAALHPEKLAFPAAIIYTPLLKITWPLVWVVNLFANQVLRSLGVYPDETDNKSALTREELRTVVGEAEAMIPNKHQKMLSNILDLEHATIENIMIPRNEIDGIDLDKSWDDLEDDLRKMPYTQALVFRKNIDNVVGVIHARRIMQQMINADFNKEKLEALVKPIYFIPKGTPLNIQLNNFQQTNRRSGLVVDEYGDVLGMVTIKDLLEEIVGEFTSDPTDHIKNIQYQEDGSYLINGSASIRELSSSFGWPIENKGPKTFNGLILEKLETMPEAGISLLVNNHPVEILKTEENAVKVARVLPKLQ